MPKKRPLPRERVLEIRPVRHVGADEAERLVPVAGGDHVALQVDHVDRAAARVAVHRFEVGVDRVYEFGSFMRRGFQHRAHAVLPRDQAGQDLEAAQLAFQARRIQVEPVRTGFLERVDRAFPREIDGRGRHAHIQHTGRCPAPPRDSLEALLHVRPHRSPQPPARRDARIDALNDARRAGAAAARAKRPARRCARRRVIRSGRPGSA